FKVSSERNCVNTLDPMIELSSRGHGRIQGGGKGHASRAGTWIHSGIPDPNAGSSLDRIDHYSAAPPFDGVLKYHSLGLTSQ
ncbi:hypothetical protein EVAR_42464_1, partial [Eumeta japonica]